MSLLPPKDLQHRYKTQRSDLRAAFTIKLMAAALEVLNEAAPTIAPCV